MDEVLLSEVRSAIAVWLVVAMAVLVWAVFYLSCAKQRERRKKYKEKGMKVFYSVIFFIFMWIAVLPFFLYGACGELPSIQGWALIIIALIFAMYALLNIKSRRRK